MIRAALLLLVLAACHPTLTTACPPIPAWSAAERAATADELDRAVAAGAIDPTGPTVSALQDYEMLRGQVEVCN